MRFPTLVVTAAVTVACSAMLVQGAHRMKWGTAGGRFGEIRTAATQLAAYVPADSPVALRAVGLPDDCFHYLRYCVIPRPLDLKLPGARRVLLLCPRASAKAAADRLAWERPDLRAVARAGGGELLLTFYRSAP